MTGVIWYVQLVVYPQLRNVSAEDFPRFHPGHTRRTGFVVAVPMLLELASGILLLLQPGSCTWSPVHSYALPLGALGLIWVSTILFQIPLHARLEKRRDEQAIEKLILGNWVRTLLWSFRSLCLLYLLFLSLLNP